MSQHRAMRTLHATLRMCAAATKYRRAGRYLAGPLGQLYPMVRARTIQCMSKRILAAFLWFYAGWYAGAMLAEFIGVSPVIGPIIGAAAAALIAGDPRRMIWARAASPVSAPSAPDGLPDPA